MMDASQVLERASRIDREAQSYEYHWGRIKTLMTLVSSEGFTRLNYAPTPMWTSAVQASILQDLRGKGYEIKVIPSECLGIDASAMVIHIMWGPKQPSKRPWRWLFFWREYQRGRAS